MAIKIGDMLLKAGLMCGQGARILSSFVVTRKGKIA
jgi:hypothetical protein